jgi:hypothetical protein
VVDEAGTPLRERVVAHDEAGIAALCRKLIELQVERVAIERPDGIVVDRMLDAGLIVIAVHPNQAKAARERYSVAHGKSDRFDAFVLAELARTDAHRLRAIRPDSDQTRALRALSRTREDLVQARVALANQLRAQLEAFWPGALVFAHVDSPVSLAFLRRYPSPADAKGLRTKRLAGWLARHGYSGRRSPEELLERMRSAPDGAPARSRSRPAGPPCSAWSPRSRRSSPSSANSPRRCEARFAPIPTLGSSRRCFETRRRSSARRR